MAGACGSGPATPAGPPAASGSGAAASPSAPASTLPTTSPAAPPTPTPVPVIPAVRGVKLAESGQSAKCGNWKVTFNKPVLDGWPAEAMAAANAAMDAAVARFVDAFKANLATGGGSGNCTLDGAYSVALAAPGLLSLRLSVTEYLGGAAATTFASSLNIDWAGAAIPLAALFRDQAAALALLSTQSRSRLLTLLSSDGVGPSWIDPGTTPNIANFDRAWVFTTGGLELTFQELQVAPHALGTPRIVIPWSALASVLDPAGPAARFLAA